MTHEDFIVKTLGRTNIKSPLLQTVKNYTPLFKFLEEDERILYDVSLANFKLCLEKGEIPLSFEKAGPRENIFFEPAKTKVAIVTCGGLCPGLNNVIRSLVYELFYRYGVTRILGIKYGYEGLVAKYNHPVIELTPELVSNIHLSGGSFLGSSRGHQDPSEIVDTLEILNVNILFCIGGDGTLRGAHAIHEEITKRNLKIVVAGIPKTIDNDISYIENRGDEFESLDPSKSLVLIEGWHSEIIITTFIQLFHSMITNRNSAARKFHNIINSILILDEVQNIPVKYWKMLSIVLEILCTKFNCWVILMSATQPLIFSNEKVKSLVDDEQLYFNAVDRYNVIFKGAMSMEEFKEHLKKEIEGSDKDLLIILNTIKSCKDVYAFVKSIIKEKYKDEETSSEGYVKFGFGSKKPLVLINLSTLIIPAHRLERIKVIRENKNVRKIIITTQLVEAGGNQLEVGAILKPGILTNLFVILVPGQVHAQNRVVVVRRKLGSSGGNQLLDKLLDIDAVLLEHFIAHALARIAWRDLASSMGFRDGRHQLPSWDEQRVYSAFLETTLAPGARICTVPKADAIASHCRSRAKGDAPDALCVPVLHHWRTGQRGQRGADGRQIARPCCTISRLMVSQ